MTIDYITESDSIGNSDSEPNSHTQVMTIDYITESDSIGNSDGEPNSDIHRQAMTI